MSMSTFVYGIRPPNEQFRAMQAVWESCQSAGVSIPDRVLAFFDGERPDPAGVRVNLTDGVAREYRDGDRMQEGYEVDVADLPEGVTAIRFVNSW